MNSGGLNLPSVNTRVNYDSMTSIQQVDLDSIQDQRSPPHFQNHELRQSGSLPNVIGGGEVREILLNENQDTKWQDYQQVQDHAPFQQYYRPTESLASILQVNEPDGKQSKSRFFISKETKKEFNLQERDIPPQMREIMPPTVDFTNHVD